MVHVMSGFNVCCRCNQVSPIALPQTVAAFHSLVGLAAMCDMDSSRLSWQWMVGPRKPVKNGVTWGPYRVGLMITPVKPIDFRPFTKGYNFTPFLTIETPRNAHLATPQEAGWAARSPTLGWSSPTIGRICAGFLCGRCFLLTVPRFTIRS